VIREAGRLFKRYNSDYPFSYTFLDDDFNKLYLSETREASLFFYFAGIAIIISCLGLFALAACTTRPGSAKLGLGKFSAPALQASLAFWRWTSSGWC
jgi:putative ABC transport system permease protein